MKLTWPLFPPTYVVRSWRQLPQGVVADELTWLHHDVNHSGKVAKPIATELSGPANLTRSPKYRFVVDINLPPVTRSLA